MLRKIYKVILPAATLALVLAAVPAWGQARAQSNIQSLEIEVVDQKSDRTLLSVAPGGGFEIDAGDAVRLRVRVTTARGQRVIYPAANFYADENSGLVLSGVRDSSSEILLEAKAAYGPGTPGKRGRQPEARRQTYQVRYELINAQVLGRDRRTQGAFSVTVKPGARPAVAARAITGYDIEIWDPQSGEMVDVLHTGETLSLTAGDPVDLRLRAYYGPDGPRPTFFHPKARFFLADGQKGLEASKRNRQSEMTTVEAGAVANRSNSELIWGLIEEEPLAPGIKRHGRIAVEIIPQVVQGAPTNALYITEILYQGILMREADDAGKEAAAARIQREGYNGVIATAVGMARSDESLDLTRDRRISASDRLETLYEYLLDLAPSEVSDSEWRQHVRLLESGQVAQVVERLVRSQGFREYHGFNRGVSRR